MGVTLGKALRRQPHPFEQVTRTLNRLALRQSMHHGGKCDRVFHGQARIQGRIAVLKHHLGLAAIVLQGQRLAAHRLAIEHQLALVVADQLHEQARRGRLAATGLAHHPQGLALEHVKAHPVHSANHPCAATQQVFLEWKVLDQAAHREHRLG